MTVLLRIPFLVLHFILVVLSIAITVPIAAVFWLVWAIELLPRMFRESSPSETQLPTVDQPEEVSLDQLLGADNESRSVDAVFEGGGVKAIAQVGAARAAEERGLKWSLLGGTSGGAIVASLLAVGKNSSDIWNVLTGIGLHRIVDAWYLPPVAFLQKRLYFYLPLFPNLLFTKGLVSGNKFLGIMRDELTPDGQELRFRNVLDPEREADPNSPRYRLKMVATDVSRGTPIVLPDDLPYYWEAWEWARSLSGRNPDELTPEDAQDWWPLATAVRMSMSIPFFFELFPLHLNVASDGETLQSDRMGTKGKKVLIVDGGASSNFPIWLFDRLDATPSWPTFGFLLDERKGQPGLPVPSIGLLYEMAMSVINTGMGAMDKRLSEHDDYRTARRRTLGVNTTAFGLSETGQAELFQAGYNDAVDFFKRFDWSYYLEEFRR